MSVDTLSNNSQINFTVTVAEDFFSIYVTVIVFNGTGEKVKSSLGIQENHLFIDRICVYSVVTGMVVPWRPGG